MNKESCLVDPIDWNSFKKEISDWASTRALLLEFIEETNLRFCERTFPCHAPRSQSHLNSSPPQNRGECVQELISMGISSRLVTLISRINKHQPLLSSLGILPNQLRIILRNVTPQFEEAFEDISCLLAVHSYQIWKTRKN